jgi:hypothetical protein
MAIQFTPHDMLASMSWTSALPCAIISARKPARHISLRDSLCDSETIGLISIQSTPNRSSIQAIWRRCLLVKLTPTLCSPSRSVESSILTLDALKLSVGLKERGVSFENKVLRITQNYRRIKYFVLRNSYSKSSYATEFVRSVAFLPDFRSQNSASLQISLRRF